MEVTVEDPAPAFRSMRDRSDIAWVLTALPMIDGGGGGGGGGGDQALTKIREWYDRSMSREPLNRSHLPFPKDEASVELVASLLKLTPAQVTFVFEALEYAVICRSATKPDSDNEVDIENSDTIPGLIKSFRLTVKRRLLNANKEIKGFQSDKAARQKLLDELYQEELARYQCVRLPSIAKMRGQIKERIDAGISKSSPS